ncbi:hypothetical protein JD844_023878, partial [Phrynosoma platyrhinos]
MFFCKKTLLQMGIILEEAKSKEPSPGEVIVDCEAAVQAETMAAHFIITPEMPHAIVTVSVLLALLALLTAALISGLSATSVLGCFKDEQHHGEGAIFRDNCNSCKCVNSKWKCSAETCLVQPGLIKQINDGSYGWKAYNYSQFWGMSLKEGYNHRLGTYPPSAALLDMKPVMVGFLLQGSDQQANTSRENVNTEADFPEFFVAWHEWPGWIHDPLDQRNCAASWAFSTASKMLVSHACYPLFWNQPHQTSCAISSVFDAEGKRQATQPCPNILEPSNRIYQCSSPYRISSKEADIMKEIKENGPVQAIMEVYQDFFLYKNGIYKHIWSIEEKTQNGYEKRPHAVKIV